MRELKNSSRWLLPLISAATAVLFTGCQSPKASAPAATTTPPAQMTMPPPATTAPAVTASGLTVTPPVYIDAGSSMTYTDSVGNVWQADEGFSGGDSTERPADLQITNTADAEIFRTEHFGMSSFSCNLPDGKYTVKLLFAETYDEVTGPGQRVFSMNVGGKEIDDFDVFAKAGGGDTACVETVDVDVTNGQLVITFTAKTQNPEINGIEILPAS